MIQKTVTKVVKRYGNSGGVYLPASWIGGTAEISLVSKPARPEEDLPLAFAGRMQHIISMFLYGSHAREDAEKGSDIDVIVITDDHQKDMEVPQNLKGRGYDIILIEVKEFKNKISRDILFNKSLEDTKVIFNDSFFNEIKSIKPTGILKERIELAKSSLRIMKSLLDVGADASSITYPLIMRIKEILLIDCVLNNKKYSLSLLKEHIQKLGISESEYRKLMSVYRAVRDEKKNGKPTIKEDTIKLLLDFLEEMIDNAEKKQTP